MVALRIYTGEVYPAHTITTEEDPDAAVVEVDEETAARWRALQTEHDEMRRQIRRLLDPPCTKCGHPTSRHQTKSSGEWGCLGWGGPCHARCEHHPREDNNKEDA